MWKMRLVQFGLVLALLLASCQPAAESTTPIGPTATLHPLFSSQRLATPTQRPTQTPLMPTKELETVEAPPDLDAIDFVRVPIFVNSLSEDWSLQNSSRVEYTVAREPDLIGENPALKVTPNDAEAVAYFSLNESGAGQFSRLAVFGVTFSVNPGSNWLRGRDMSIAIVGSNENDYWIPGDTSVESPFNFDPVFSETGLHFLGVEGSIPPQNWIPFELFLDNLVFDPTYENVTAIYFKFAPDLRNPIFLNNIELLLLPDDLREDAP